MVYDKSCNATDLRREGKRWIHLWLADLNGIGLNSQLCIRMYQIWVLKFKRPMLKRCFLSRAFHGRRPQRICSMEAELNVSKSQQHSLVIGPGGVQVPGGVHDLFIEEIIPNVGKRCHYREFWSSEALAAARFAWWTRKQRVTQISTFWSPSWHGGHWKKILTLLLQWLCCTLGWLFGSYFDDDSFWFWSSPWLGSRIARGPSFSMWCVRSGFLVITLLLRSQNNIFLNRICISQEDNDLKAQAIFSFAGYANQVAPHCSAAGNLEKLCLMGKGLSLACRPTSTIHDINL